MKKIEAYVRHESFERQLRAVVETTEARQG